MSFLRVILCVCWVCVCVKIMDGKIREEEALRAELKDKGQELEALRRQLSELHMAHTAYPRCIGTAGDSRADVGNDVHLRGNVPSSVVMAGLRSSAGPSDSLGGHSPCDGSKRAQDSKDPLLLAR